MFIKQRLDYITLMEKCGITQGTTKHNELISTTTTAILQAVRCAKVIQFADASILNDFLTSALPKPNVDTIMAALHVKVPVGASHVSPSAVLAASYTTKQSHMFLDNYATDEWWGIFMSAAPEGTKLFAMAMLFHGLGLLSASEKTYAYGAALATQIAPTNVDELLIAVRKLKRIVKSIVEDRGSKANERGPLEYPERPETLQDICVCVCFCKQQQTICL